MTGVASTSASTAVAARRRKCWDINNVLGVVVPSTREGCHDATGGMVGGQIGYRWQSANWVFGLEAQGDWADLKGSNATLLARCRSPSFTNQTKIDAIGLFTGQVGYAWNNVLWYVKGGAAVTHDKYNGHRSARRHRSTAPAKPAGAARSAPASKSASRRTGRSRSNTTTCSWAATTSPSAARPVGAVEPHRQHPAGRRHGHRSRQLPLRRPGRREVLIATAADSTPSDQRPASRRPFCLLRLRRCCPTCCQLGASNAAKTVDDSQLALEIRRSFFLRS